MPARLLVIDGSGGTAAVADAAAIVRGGGLVGYPTDTFYGLAADPRHDGAVTRLFGAKGRPEALAIPLIAADLAQVEQVGDLTPLARRLAQRFWPGPLTLVVAARPGLSSAVLASGPTVAVRVPDHPVAIALAAAAGFAVTSTSANRSGEPPTTRAADVVRALGDAVDAVLDGGVCRGGLPSTIVDATGDRPRLVRDGAVPWDRIVQSTVG